MKNAVYKGPLRSLSVEDDELLTVARGVVGEGGEGVSETTAASYLWAIMNRCLLYSGADISYADMWRAFSQPINPKWRRDGVFCLPGGKGYGAESCSEAKLARRDRINAMDWSDIPASVTRWVLDFQAGYLPSPVEVWGSQKMTNWASASTNTPKKFPWGMEIGGEWFFEDKGTRGEVVAVEQGERRMIPPSPYRGLGKILGGIAVAALAGIGWLLAKTHLWKSR
jgi:hypothetical protein